MPDPLTAILAAFAAAGVGGGLLLLAVWVRGVPPTPGRPSRRRARLAAALRSPAWTSRMGGALLVAVLVVILTRWPVAAAGMGLLVVLWPQLFGGQRVEQAQIQRLEALVIWTEAIRDTITARASLEQAIPATTHNAPELIRPALIRLAGLLRARVPLDRALLALSAELDDASADKVIGALILNARQRGTGLADVLTALAAAARAELDQRRQITAGRASMRRSVQLVVAITIGFGVFLVIFSRSYVQPYGTPLGQLMLAVVLGFFGCGFFWMRQLAGGDRATPFLQRPDAATTDADSRVVSHLTGDASTENPLNGSPWAGARGMSS